MAGRGMIVNNPVMNDIPRPPSPAPEQLEQQQQQQLQQPMFPRIVQQSHFAFQLQSTQLKLMKAGIEKRQQILALKRLDSNFNLQQN